MVGREAERTHLTGLVARIRSGSGRAVVIAGEPGVGKTRMVRELVGAVTEAGVAVAVGRAVEDRAPVPLRPLLEASLSLTRSVPLPDRAMLGPYASVLGALVPEWSVPGTDRMAASAPLLGEGLLRLVLHVAPRGCVLVVEDAHWADPESLAVLEYLCDHVTAAPLLVVVTVRETHGAARSVVDGLVTRGSAELVPLAPLSPDEVAAMVRACGVPHRAGIAEASAGLPLLVEELLGDRSEVPRGLVDSVVRRVAALGGAAPQVLLAAAVLGQHFDWRLVAAATDVPVETVGSVLAAASRAGLISADGDDHQFRHALTRHAVLASGTAPQVAALAGRLVEALRLRSPDLPGETAALAAGLAERAGDDTASDLLLLAGARAARDGSLASAAALLDRAVVAARSPSARIATLDAVAGVHCDAGRLDAAVAVTRRLCVLARERHDDVVLRAAHLRLARALAEGARWEEAEVELKSVARAGEPGEPEAALVEAIVLLGRHQHVEAAQRAAAVTEPALDTERPDLACEALEVVGRAARNRDEAAALAAFERAYTLAVAYALPLAAMSALHELGTIDMFTTGRRDRLLAARAAAETAGAVRLAAVLDLQLVAAHHMHGDVAAADACACRALEGATTLGITPMAVIGWALTACPVALTADRDAVESAIAAIPPGTLDADPDSQASLWGTSRATCSLLREDRAAAVEQLETAARIVDGAREIRPQTWWGFWVLLQALEGRDAVASIARLRSGPAAGNRLNLAYAELAEAVLAGRAGDGTGAAATVERWDAARLPWAWLRHLGRRLVAEAALADGWGEPRRWLTDAAEFFDGFGTPAVPLACRALLAGAPPTPADWRPDGVTAREAQILALIGDGVTGTRELAARLVISPRTVEKHVEALCRKLGVRTRSHLAVLAARHAARQARART